MKNDDINLISSLKHHQCIGQWYLGWPATTSQNKICHNSCRKHHFRCYTWLRTRVQRGQRSCHALVGEVSSSERGIRRRAWESSLCSCFTKSSIIFFFKISKIFAVIGRILKILKLRRKFIWKDFKWFQKCFFTFDTNLYKRLFSAIDNM